MGVKSARYETRLHLGRHVTAPPYPPSSRSKREDIINVAIEYFGQHGYEYTKWADIAKAVGIGSTALYHYFESKLHCLYEIQALAVEADREKFERVIAEHDDFAEALRLSSSPPSN